MRRTEFAGANPVLDFGIDRDALGYVGHDLQRPECILAEPNGALWVADARGGVVRIQGGEQGIITQRRSQHFDQAASEATRYLEGTLPNGLAFARNGDILISNFGTDCLELMSRDGASRVLADSVDGYLARYEDGTFHIVADGFHFTNEIRFDANEQFMYVVETTGGRITRLRVDDGGNVRDREVFGPSRLGKGAWPDGIAFDSYGNLWGTLVYSDKLFVLTPEGDMRVLLDEGDPVKVDALEQAFLQNDVTEDVLFATGCGVAPWMASVTFGGRDLRTVYIGSLKGKRIPFFRAPVAGLPMVHWQERL